MEWNHIFGQDNVKSTLVQYVQSGQLPHALLLLGKEGAGGLPLAIGFAQYLLCENKLAHGQSCGQCIPCLKTKKLVHPDLHFNFPSIPPSSTVKTNSKHFINEFRAFYFENPYGNVFEWLKSIGAKDRQSGNISAEESREMVERLSLKAMEGAFKIQIIWRPEYLGIQGNALLKLIEEPPSNTIFLLVVEDVDLILDTILSRTQLIRLQQMSSEAVQQVLQNVYNVDAELSAKLAVLADGNVSAALELMNDTEGDMLQLLKDWFNGVFTYNGNLIGKWIDITFKMTVVQLKNFLMYVQKILGHTLRMTMIPNYLPALAEDDLDFVKRLSSRKFDYKTIEAMDKLIGEAIYHLQRNANIKVVLLHLSVALQYVLKGTKLEA